MVLPLIDLLMLALLVICLITDLRSRKIYNPVVLVFIVVGLVYHLVDEGWAGVLFSLQGLAVGMLLLIIPFVMGKMGAGDVKLLGAVGALQGPAFVFHAFLASAIAGGVLAVITLARKRMAARVLQTLGFSFIYRVPLSGWESGVYIPYGVAVFVGTLAYYFLGWHLQW
ncbi:MAG: prepilin peptidase [Peptococcaceae bacterium]|nr:prepilin peptidase [Peptococcaceae bacterium]